MLATPGWLLLVAAAVTLLTAALVAPLLFARAADGAALDSGLAAVDEDAFASTSADVRATWDGVLPTASEQVVRQALGRLPSYRRPVVSAQGLAGRRGSTPSVIVPGQEPQASVLYYRDGAVAALGGTPGTRGIWLAAEVADALGVSTGDQVLLGLERVITIGEPRRAPATVAGTFQRSPGSALPAALAADATVARRDLPWDPDRPGVGRPLVVADRRTFGQLALAIGEEPLWTADLTLSRDVGPAEASTAARAVQRLGQRAFVETTDVARATRSAEPAPTRLQVTSGLPDIVVEARATGEAAQAQADPFATAGAVLATAVVAAAVLLLGRSRTREQNLVSGLGMHPAEVGLLSGLETLLPALLGAVAGATTAWVVVATAGPPGRLDGAWPDVLTRTAAAFVLVLAVAVVAAGLTAAVTDRRALSSRLGVSRRRVPWEAVVIVTTVVSGVAVATTPLADRPASPLAVLFPLLLATTVSLVVLRVVAKLADRRAASATRQARATPRWLAARRSRSAPREVAAVTLALAVGLAMLGYTLAAHRGVTHGVDDKIGALVGSRTVVDVGTSMARKRIPSRQPRIPRSPVPGGTVVYRQLVSLPPAFGSQPLMAIDAKTFASAADWGSSGALSAGRDLLPRLRERGPDLPVLLVGDTDREVGDKGIFVSYEEWSARYVVVGVVDAFPGSETESADVTVVAAADALLRFVPSQLDPRLIPPPTVPDAGRLSTWVWSHRSPAGVALSLDRAGIVPQASLLRSTAASRPELRAASWSSGYVVALGAAALLLVGAATLVLAARLADRDAVTDVLLRRMGFRVADLAGARTWEVATVVAGSVVAAAVSVLVLAVAPTTVEPAADVLPLTRPAPALVDALVLVAGCLTLTAAAAVVGRRRAATRDAAEVLRADG
jgi:hypothetical protein